MNTTQDLKLHKTYYVDTHNINSQDHLKQVISDLKQAKINGYDRVRDKWGVSGVTVCGIDLVITELEKRL